MLRLLRFSRSTVQPGRLLLRGAAALGVALLLAGGSLVGATGAAHASGCANVPPGYMVHTATSANTHGDYTDLDEPEAAWYNCAFDPVFIQPRWVSGKVFFGSFDSHPVGLWYDPDGKWAIINEDGAPMPLGATFNVYLISEYEYPADAAALFPQFAAGGSYITYLNAAGLNGNHSAQLMVTQVENLGAEPAVINPHQIGIWYDSSRQRWAIYNEDQAPIPAGAEFSVMALEPSGLFPNAFTQVATSSNTSGDSTCINNVLTNQSPNNTYLFVTHVYSGYFTDVPGVWYNTSLGEWCIFDGSYNTMPLGATFSVALP